jgi:hypothetical protein
VLLGKFQNPVSGTQLIWDDDAGIQGINVLFDAGKHTGGDFIEQLALGGLFYYLEDYTGDAHDDVFMAGPTFQSRFAVADSVKLTFNLSYYDTHNADGIAQAIGSGALSTAQGAFATSNLTAIGPVNIGGATPATLVGTGFASDFNLLNPYIELALMTGSVPVKFFVDQVWNIGAAGFGATHDYGIMTGTKIGDNGKPGSPWVGYQFAWIEADATFDAFNDDQIGTNIISHYLEGGIRIAKNLKLFATLNFHKDLNPLFRGYGDAMGTQIPGILVPIHDDPWAVRSRAYIAASF